MKSGISSALRAHYASDSTTLATLWFIARADGVRQAFTDHDRDITFPTQTDFADPDIVEEITYRTTSTFDSDAVKTTASMAVDDVSLTGLLAVDGITAADIEAGCWDAGKVQILRVNWRDLSMGCEVLRFGELGEIQRQGKSQYTAEIRGLGQYLQNNLGRTVAAACDADFGDARCGVDKEALRRTCTVTAVTSNRVFTASIVGTFNDETYSLGVALSESGANDGLSMEMKSVVAGLFTLQLDMPYVIEVGDTFTIVPGCNKIGRLGHCKVVYDNYINFRGFEDIPGQNKTNLVGGQ